MPNMNPRNSRNESLESQNRRASLRKSAQKFSKQNIDKYWAQAEANNQEVDNTAPSFAPKPIKPLELTVTSGSNFEEQKKKTFSKPASTSTPITKPTPIAKSKVKTTSKTTSKSTVKSTPIAKSTAREIGTMPNLSRGVLGTQMPVSKPTAKPTPAKTSKTSKTSKTNNTSTSKSMPIEDKILLGVLGVSTAVGGVAGRRLYQNSKNSKNSTNPITSSKAFTTPKTSTINPQKSIIAGDRVIERFNNKAKSVGNSPSVSRNVPLSKLENEMLNKGLTIKQDNIKPVKSTKSSSKSTSKTGSKVKGKGKTTGLGSAAFALWDQFSPSGQDAMKEAEKFKSKFGRYPDPTSDVDKNLYDSMNDSNSAWSNELRYGGKMLVRSRKKSKC